MPKLKERSVLPGFGLSLGYTVVYLSVLVLIPLSMLFYKSATGGWDNFKHSAFDERTIAAYKVTFGCSLVAALVNVVFGVLVAWVLVRYKFPGKSLVDAVVDLPFALPTAVGGIALTAAYAPNGVVGKPVGEWFAKFSASPSGHSFLESHLGKLIEGVLALDYADFKIAYTRLGIIIALIFISLPFVVRTVQPVLQELDVQLEEAAASLGAGRWATFRRVILPYAFPAILTGFALGFARAIGEYGSVVFIAANLPMKTEIAPLLIANKLGEDNIPGATGIAVVMLVISFVLLLSINGLQYWTSRRTAA